MSEEVKSVDISDVASSPVMKVPDLSKQIDMAQVFRVYIISCFAEDCPMFGFWEPEFDTKREADREVKAHNERYHPDAIQESR
jgi:hypothetical protein